MTLTISLPPDEERKLSQRAAASGQDVTQYIQQLIHKDVSIPSFAELFEPVHQAVRESGLDESEVDCLIQTAIADSRRSSAEKVE